MSTKENTSQSTPGSANDTMLNVRIPAEVKRRLAVEAVASGERLSDVVRRLLVLHTNEKGAQA